MPLLATALSAYVAGLFAGFSSSLGLGAVAVAAAMAIGVRFSSGVACAFTMLALTGAANAVATRASDVRCLGAAAHRSVVMLELVDAAAPRPPAERPSLDVRHPSGCRWHTAKPRPEAW